MPDDAEWAGARSAAETPDHAQEVRRRVTELVPVLRERARDTEKAGHMLPETLTELTEIGVFRLMTPTDHGGFEAPPSTVAAILSEIARGCPSTAWMCTITVAASWWPTALPDAGAAEIFATPDLRLTGVFQPGGSATAVAGGVRLTGKWRWNTAGCHSNWLGLAAVRDQDPLVLCFVPADSASVNLEWDACGMAGTASNGVTVEDVFVPECHIATVDSLFTGDYPPNRYDRPYFRYPAVQMFTALTTPAFVGMARGAMHAWRERVVGRGIAYSTYTDQTQATSTQLALADAARELECAEIFGRRALDALERHTGSTPPIEDRIRCRTYLGWCAQAAQRCINTLFGMSGASAVQHSVDIQRYWRDVNTLVLHGAVDPTTSDELYGRWLLGAELNTTLF